VQGNDESWDIFRSKFNISGNGVILNERCDSSVTVNGYGLDDQSLISVQICSGTHPPSYPVGISHPFPGVKAAGAGI